MVLEDQRKFIRNLLKENSPFTEALEIFYEKGSEKAFAVVKQIFDLIPSTKKPFTVYVSKNRLILGDLGRYSPRDTPVLVSPGSKVIPISDKEVLLDPEGEFIENGNQLVYIPKNSVVIRDDEDIKAAEEKFDKSLIIERMIEYFRVKGNPTSKRIRMLYRSLTGEEIGKKDFAKIQFVLSKENDLETLVELYPNKPWNWGGGLSKNPNITWEFIEEHSEYPWDWIYISENPNITWENVRDNPDKDWSWYKISKHPNITFEIVRDNLRPWNWSGLSLNPNITWDIVQNYPNIPWSWFRLSANPNITWEIVKENLESDDPKRWSWTGLSVNPNITWEIVKENLESDDPVRWDWRELSRNPNITWKNIRDNPDLPWEWDYISLNPNITWKNVRDNPDKDWSWFRLSQNPNITLKNVLENLGSDDPKDWNWKNLSQNPSITWENIRDNPDLPWNWKYVSENPNITWEIVRYNPDRDWDWKKLSYNLFKKDPVVKRKEIEKEAKYIINDLQGKYPNVERLLYKNVSKFL